MSLRERADEIRRSRRYRVQLTHSTLYRYYRQANVSFKTVDLHAVKKLMYARRIRAEQRNYCIRIRRLQESKAVFFLDETTTSLRKKCKKRTWTNGVDVALPYQNERDHNRSIVGAVGGQHREVFFHSKVFGRCRKEQVHEFLEELLRLQPYPKEDLVIVCDNHRSHKSHLVRDLLAANNVQLEFLPIYSSVFSPVERVWWIFKQEWIKQLSKINVNYDVNNLDRDIQFVANKVGRTLTSRVLHTADDYIRRSIAGQLV